MENPKTIISNSIVVALITFFILILMAFMAEQSAGDFTSGYWKMLLPAIAVCTGIVYGFSKYQRIRSAQLIPSKIISHSFEITHYAFENIANTEYFIYACQTTDRQTVIFQTEILNPFNMGDSLIIELKGNRIHTIQQFSTGREVTRIMFPKSLLDSYPEEFYLLNTTLDKI